MMLKSNWRSTQVLALLVAIPTFSRLALAQQAQPPVTPMTPAPDAGGPATSAPTGPSTADASQAPAEPVPNQAAPAPLAPASPVAADSTPSRAFAPLDTAPVPEQLQPEKKKKRKKLKARKAKREQNEALKETRDDGDVVWGDPWGDSQDELRAAGLSFRFLLQTHYRQTFAFQSNNPDPNYRVPEETLVRQGDGWDLNRFFFRIAAEPSKYVGVKIITDFAEFAHKNGNNAVKQAYVDLRPVPKHVHILAGVLKLPFSITELDPIAKYEFSRMGQANDLIKGLGFAGRDIGAEVMVTPLDKPRYLTMAVGTFRGHANNENGNLFGEVGARATTEPIKGLRFGVDVEIMPKTVTYLSPFDTKGTDLLPNPENPNFPRARTWEKGQAASADVTFHRSGLMLRTEGMVGTRVDHDTQYGASKFGAVWGIAAYRFSAGSLSLQPALRAELLDTDLNHTNGLRTQIAAGLGTYFTKSVRFLLDIERTIVQDQSPYIDQPLPLRALPYNALSNTCIAGQVQVVL